MITKAELERLNYLSEEMAEVQQVICKIIKHGFYAMHPNHPEGFNNQDDLEKEIGHVRNAIEFLFSKGDIRRPAVATYQFCKSQTFGQYLRHNDPEN